jgi:hypothetical protein
MSTSPHHYPLTDREIEELAGVAWDTPASSPYRLERIQVRLLDAIPGMTVPRPIDGAVADRMNAMERLFVDGRHAMEFDAWVKELQVTINGDSQGVLDEA